MNHQKSIIVSFFSRIIEFGNDWLTLSQIFFRSSRNVFRNLEIMMLAITVICVGILFYIHQFPYWVGLAVSILLIQRVIEFLVVYSRNFIFHRGRIFSHYEDPSERSQWLILMFILNIIQLILIFAIWYRFITFVDPSTFSQTLSVVDSLYFSIVTFLTVGYGDIIPLTGLAKGLVIFQGILTFYTLVIVINGLISIHFRK